MADVFDLEDIHPVEEARRNDSDDDAIEIDDVSFFLKISLSSSNLRQRVCVSVKSLLIRPDPGIFYK